MVNKLNWTSLLVVLLVITQVQSCSKNPVTGENELALMSKQDEVQMGKKHYPIMTQVNNGELPDENLQSYVQKIGNQLVKVSHRPDLPYEFNIVNSSSINAYALPGGKISVTRGLLLEMDDERELAAVLGHEIAHVTARHSVQQQTQSLLAGVVLRAGGIYMESQGVSNAGLYQNLGKIGAKAVLASYSRSQEQQADRLGIQYMAKAGYDPQGMIELQNILLRMRKNEPGLVQQLFASHPLSERRISDSKDKIDEIQGNIDIPVNNQLQQFNRRVVSPWYPRKPAYTSMDSGVKRLSEDQISPAIDHFRDAAKIYDQEALFYAWMGKALQMDGNLEEARQSLDRAKNLRSDLFRIRLFSGINHFKLENYDQSLDELQKANEFIPDIPNVMYFRGRNHEEINNQERAAHFYHEFLRRVKEGEKARYCMNRLRQWGYI